MNYSRDLVYDVVDGELVRVRFIVPRVCVGMDDRMGWRWSYVARNGVTLAYGKWRSTEDAAWRGARRFFRRIGSSFVPTRDTTRRLN